MTWDKIVVDLLGLALIAFIVWFFWLVKAKGTKAALTSGGYQEQMVLVKGGYTPDVIVVESGASPRVPSGGGRRVRVRLPDGHVPRKGDRRAVIEAPIYGQHSQPFATRNVRGPCQSS
jgi:plastocyanin domain-containing protein